jgi:PAT family beta-lactamase induction signal transducer AmpG
VGTNAVLMRAHADRPVAPLWMMGLTNSVYGMFAGIILIAIPEILSARHVPETTIAGMTALMVSPGFWTFLASPVLDVRFSRRWYAASTASFAALCLLVALLNLDRPLLIQWLLCAGFFFANLYTSALGGWLSTITAADKENTLSTWVTIGNVGGTGAMALVAGELIRTLSPIAAALLLVCLLLLPLAVFAFMPAPGPDRRLAAESFGQFFGDVLGLLRKREVLIAVVLFVAPAGTFSLTNFLAGLGDDFHASAHLTSVVGGSGVLIGSVVGCFLFRTVDRLMPLRRLYLAIGAAGSLFTLALMLLPRTPPVFALAFIVENVFQGLAITTSIAVTFETIGRNNPLAATTYCLVNSAYSVPISYMLIVDGAGYAANGVAGSFAIDGGLGLMASVLLMVLVRRVMPRNAQPASA